MVALDRIRTNANICSIEIAFKGISIPSVLEGWQPFYNSTFDDADFTQAYSTLSSLEFAEEKINNAAGPSYKQKVVFRFPANDAQRTERIVLLEKIKFVKLNLTEGQSILIGRNDYNQNKLPEIGIKTNHHFCEVSIEALSISPSGFVPSSNFGLPSLIPVQQ